MSCCFNNKSGIREWGMGNCERRCLGRLRLRGLAARVSACAVSRFPNIQPPTPAARGAGR